MRFFHVRRIPDAARLGLALICAVVAAIGAILPIIPGWPCFILAIVLLGRRHYVLRRARLIGRGGLRHLRRSPQPSIRRVGWRLSKAYARSSRLIAPMLTAAERAMRT